MKIERIDENLLQEVTNRARASARLRSNHNFHPTAESNPHRFLNVLTAGTYIAPHRHLNPPKSETFVILSGTVGFLVFADDGQPTHTVRMGAGTETRGIDLEPGPWHSLVVLSEEAVCFEVKPGPYRAQDDKEFAAWAPREGEPGSERYLETMLGYFGV